MNEVLTRIENLMELRGMTQKQFCDASGINTSTYCTYKKRDTIPGTEILIRMANAHRRQHSIRCSREAQQKVQQLVQHLF